MHGLPAALATAFYNCGIDKHRQGAHDGAIADFSQCLRFDPDCAPALLGRGYALDARRQWTRAAADFRRACEIGLLPRQEDAVRLRLWLLGARTGQVETANLQLSGHFACRKSGPAPSPWTSWVASFLLGLPEPEFLQGMDSPVMDRDAGHACQGWFFAGAVRLLSGDAQQARLYFDTAIGTDARHVEEYWSARAEAEALRSAGRAE